MEYNVQKREDSQFGECNKAADLLNGERIGNVDIQMGLCVLLHITKANILM